MKIIKPNELNIDFFSSFKDNWALVVTQDTKEDNAMTIAWGGVGILWGREVVTVYIRNTRYTKHMLDDSQYFSVSFFDDKYKDKLAYCGKVSRRDEDKITNAKFTRSYEDGVLYLKEAKITFILKKIYQVDMPLDGVDEKIVNRYYKPNEMHTQYVGEIVKVIVEE